MLRFIVRRLLMLIPTLFGLSILLFLWVHSLPGGPAATLYGERGSAQLTRLFNHQHGFDRPIYVQYWAYFKQVLSGNLGTSIATTRTVTYELQQRFPATVELMVGAMIFSVSIGIPLGFMAAKKYGSWRDRGSLLGSLIGISIPIFVLGPILKYIFAVRLQWLPSIGRETVTADYQHPTNFYILDGIIERNPAQFWDACRHLILPAICLGSIPLAVITRITRAAVLDVQNEDYVRTARAKGMPPNVVDRRHVLRNAMLPVSTIIGLQTGLLLSGAVLTETIFVWPGVGGWIAAAIFNRDYAVIQGGVLLFAVIFVFTNLLVDISYALINPRIRLS